MDCDQVRVSDKIIFCPSAREEADKLIPKQIYVLNVSE
jgi:hypothetical protein